MTNGKIRDNQVEMNQLSGAGDPLPDLPSLLREANNIVIIRNRRLTEKIFSIAADYGVSSALISRWTRDINRRKIRSDKTVASRHAKRSN